MGLDMNIFAERYLHSWQEDTAKQIKQIEKVFPELAGYAPQTVTYEIMYWRKANAVHGWFCENLESVENCENSYVDPDILFALRDLCEQVIQDPKQASKLLPTETGFFWGSQEYDEYYMKQITKTRDWLNGFLTRHSLGAFQGWDFYYRASW